MVSSKVRGYIKRITIELKYMAMKLKHRPGGLTRKRPGHNINAYNIRIQLTQSTVLSQ